MGTSWGCGVRACGGGGGVAHVDDVGADRLVLGRDDSVLRWGPAVVGGDHPGAGLPDTVRYEYARAAEGLLLSVPDATAWWWGRGGDWRRRIRPAVTTVELV